MIKRIAVTAGAACLALTMTTGCIGGMALSGKVREFNLSAADGKWAREGIFLLLYIIPVYPIAGTIDLLIINSIEFHSGTNPVSGKARIANAGDTHREVAPDGTAAVSTLRKDGSIDLWLTGPDGTSSFVNLEDVGDRLVARDASGETLGSVTRDGVLEVSGG